MRKIDKKFLWLSVSCLVLSACGGSNSSDNNPVPPPPSTPPSSPTGTKLTGQVTAPGYAQCNVGAEDLAGASVGEAVFSDQFGAFTLEVGENTGPLLITASDCTYTDDFTSAPVSNGLFRSFLTQVDFSSESDIFVQLTPFTELAVRYAETLASNSTATEASLSQADKIFLPVFGRLGFDYRTTFPVLVTETGSISADDNSRDYGLALAALSGVGDRADVLDEFAEDLSIEDLSLSEEKLFSILFNDLKDGAVAFEATGRNVSGTSSTEYILSSSVIGNQAASENTLAPIANVETFVVNVETATSPNRPIAWETLFSDADSPDGSLQYVILGEICDNKIGAASDLPVACDNPGTYSFFVAAIDPDGNVTVIPATANINLPLTDTQAASFLISSTFGPTAKAIEDLENQGRSNWVQSQLALPVHSILNGMSIPFTDTSSKKWETVPRERWYERAVLGEDQLRQRAAFSLSQIFVVSTEPRDWTFKSHLHARHMDIMQDGAFGNYRALMQDITYSPLMGSWLTYIGNAKADPDTGNVPDENYARELMQLFTIGLVELNLDGTAKLDSDGKQIEVYTNEDIKELSKVFTGLWWANTAFGVDLGRPAIADIDVLPMEMTESQHSPLSKTFLGKTIPAGTPGDQSISMALDTLFEHPNLAPFVSKQLIQRTTTSNPSPAYVRRVVEAFETGLHTLPNGQITGTGTRGDLGAVWAAILLDPEAINENRLADNTFGKLREPLIRFLHWARYANVSAIEVTNDAPLRNGATTGTIGQTPYRAPSVFNYYRPGYVAGGTDAAVAGLVSPEMQITHTATAISYANFMADFIFRKSTKNWGGDYASALALSNDTDAVIDHLDLILTAGRMTDTTRIRVREVYESVEPSDGIKLATQLIVMSPEFTTQH